MTQPDLAISGKLFVDGEFFAGAAVLRGDKVIDLLPVSQIPSNAEHLDYGELWVLPGLVDAHVHLRDFKETSKEDFESGTKAAVAGGFSTVLAMPNTVPPLSSPRRFVEAVESAGGRTFCDVGFHCGLPGSQGDAREMMLSGAFSMKLYPEDLLDLLGGRSSCSAKDLEQVGLTLYVHAEDEDCTRERRWSFGSTLSGASKHAEVRPPSCEIRAIENTLGNLSTCDLHFAHVTTQGGLEALKVPLETKKVSAEAAVHHLLKTDAEATAMGGVAKVNPPLRGARDVEALRGGVNQGLISLIVSDHAPHTLAEKRETDYDKIPAGTPGLETALSAVLKMVQNDQLGLVEALRCMTRNPCRRFGLTDAGRVGPGFLASLVVVDPKETWTVNPEYFFSKAKYSLFDGDELMGRVKMTMVRGKISYEDGYVTGKPKGEVLRRRPT